MYQNIQFLALEEHLGLFVEHLLLDVVNDSFACSLEQK